MANSRFSISVFVPGRNCRTGVFQAGKNILDCVPNSYLVFPLFLIRRRALENRKRQNCTFLRMLAFILLVSQGQQLREKRKSPDERDTWIKSRNWSFHLCPAVSFVCVIPRLSSSLWPPTCSFNKYGQLFPG